ncbi:MAG: vanadium-dependent haloperoxidase [Myxococcota bacterium]
MGDETSVGLSRRELLSSATTGTAVLAMAGGAATLVPSTAHAEVITPTHPIKRYKRAWRVRARAATNQFFEALGRGTQPTNDDDELYDDYRASFHKCLPHNDYGEVDAAAYEALRDAFDSGDPDDFEALTLSAESDRRLANPQAALAFSLTGIDPHATRMPAAPAFASATAAAEMGEVYWHALLREVPFSDYGSDPLVGQALADLNAFSETVGPNEGGLVTAGTLFRGETPADLIGPYVSQFLLKDVQMGQARIVQRYPTPDATDFMTDHASWLAIQRGAAPSDGIGYLPGDRYIYNARALGEYVHIDALYQAYLFAALIGLGFGGDALAPNAYTDSATQGGFSTLGGADILDTVAHVANLALRAAWFQKWAAHRRLRPEMMAARVHFEAEGERDYGLSDEILSSAAVAELQALNGNALLPLAFPEGSPTHPSYPAGHAAVAGACCTVIKAFFNEDFVIPDPVVAASDGLSLVPFVGEDLTLGGEINKLGNNISLGRDLAGVHYRSDGVDGINVGEDVAIRYLADLSRTYNEDDEGFTLTRFDGQQVLIADGDVYEI